MNPRLDHFKSQSVAGLFLYFGILASVSTSAQPAMILDNPALPPASISRALTPSPPALGDTALPIPANAATNFSVAGLSGLIAGLQAQVQQLLPVLNAFNNSFDFISIGSSTNGGGFPGTAANLSSSAVGNFASNAGANLSSSVAVSTLNTGSATSLNTFGLPPDLGVAPITSETLRSLLVLESDIERMLPTLTALNGASNASTGIGLTPGFAPGAVYSVFMVPSTLR